MHIDVFYVTSVGGVFCMLIDIFLIGVDCLDLDGDVLGVAFL